MVLAQFHHADACGHIDHDVDYHSGVSLSVRSDLKSLQDCCNWCRENVKCGAWVWGWGRTGRSCYLKSAAPSLQEKFPLIGIISGLPGDHILPVKDEKREITTKNDTGNTTATGANDSNDATTLATTTTTTSSAGGPLRVYKQCGGHGWKGTGSCAHGFHCAFVNHWYSQCEPGGVGPQQSSRPGETSLFCFSLVAPSSYEAGVVAKQFELHAGLFACDGHVIISNVSADQLFPSMRLSSSVQVSTIEGSIWVPVVYGSHGHPHVLNTPVFQKAWDVIFRDGTYQHYDWTLKLDVDAVIVPPRVRSLLWWRPKHDGQYDSAYLLDTGTDALGNLLHGPVEVLSATAMEVFRAGANRCRKDVDSSKWGEDFYLNSCLIFLGVPGVKELRLLKDAYMWGQKHVDCSSGEAVFHPLKTSEEWARCVQQIGQPAVAVSLAMEVRSSQITQLAEHAKDLGASFVGCLVGVSLAVMLLVRGCPCPGPRYWKLAGDTDEDDGILGGECPHDLLDTPRETSALLKHAE